MPIDLPVISGQVPYAVEDAINRLREELERTKDELEKERAIREATPAPLTIEEIWAALSPTGPFPLATAGLLNTEPPPTTPPPTPPPSDNIPDYLAVVQAVHASLGVSGASTDEQMFRFIQTVVQDINLTGTVPAGIVCGLCLAPPAGANVFTCAGITYRYGRLCFSNGHLFDVLIDADPGGARTPQWADNGFDPSLYSVATDPSSPC